MRRIVSQPKAMSWLALVAAALFVLSTAQAGAAPAPAEPAPKDSNLRARAEEAFQAARALTLRESLDVRLDAVWHIDMLLTVRPDPQLKWWADLRRRIVSDHDSYRLVEPSAERIPLPREPGRGLEKWHMYMEAPFGRPEHIAIAFIEEYIGPELDAPETGYILTHQLAVLEWAEETGLELPPRLVAMKPVLLERIAAEHAKDDTFSDLFAERMFFMVIWGNPSDAELERTVRIIVDAQVEPGVWAPPPVTLSYDGESRVTAVEPEHARKMAMVVLAEYLRRIEDRGSGVEDGGSGAGDRGPGAEDRGPRTADRGPQASNLDPRAEDAVGVSAAWFVLLAVGVLALLFFILRHFRRR